MNDETSVLLRLPEGAEKDQGIAHGEPTAPASVVVQTTTAQVVKLMQSEANLAVLVTSKGRKHVLTFRIPVPVRGMDHGTAECVKATVDSAWAGYPSLESLFLASEYT